MSHGVLKSVPLEERYVHDVPAKPAQQPRLEPRWTVLDNTSTLGVPKVVRRTVDLDGSFFARLRHVQRQTFTRHVLEDVRPTEAIEHSSDVALEPRRPSLATLICLL